MEAHSKAVGLIPQAAQQLHAELIGLTLQGLTGARPKHLLTLFSQRADHQFIGQIQLPQGLHHGRELAFAAIDHHHVRPIGETVGLQGRAPSFP